VGAQFSRYKILFHDKAFSWESSILLLTPAPAKHTLLQYYGPTIAQYTPPPPTPPLNAINHTILRWKYRVKAKAQSPVVRINPKVEVCVGARNSACWLSPGLTLECTYDRRVGLHGGVAAALGLSAAARAQPSGWERQTLRDTERRCAPPHFRGVSDHVYLYKLNHKSTNTGLGSTRSAPRGGDIGDKEREVRTGRSQGSRPSGHARTK